MLSRWILPFYYSFYYSASVAVQTMLKHASQSDDSAIVFHVCFSDGCCDIGGLSASLARQYTYFRKVTIEGPIAHRLPSRWAEIVLFPASLSIACSNLRVDFIQLSSRLNPANSQTR